MLGAMTHRGPDDEGRFVSAEAMLGARRLSIIDLQTGHQPIANETGRLHLVFNGEIYNYRELRRYLDTKGHVFRSVGDAEVILHLYEDLGVAALDRLSGIFALALWDQDRRELLLARDRMGVKPLYYAEVTDGVVFGSELRVLLAHPSVHRRLNLSSLNEYLSYEYVPSPRTILQDVHRLPPGSYLTWNGHEVRVVEYWRPSLARSERHSPVQWRDFAGGLRDAITASVAQELVADVPVGVLLSGGLDSSVVAAVMASLRQEPIDSFTIGFDEPSFDESPYARMVANHLGTRHHELRLTNQMAREIVPRIGDLLDEPLGDASFIPTYFLSRLAREHVKVALGGDGSDELFAGYPTLSAHRLIEYYERLVPWTLRTYAAQALLQRLPVSFEYFSRDFKLRRFLSGRGVPLEIRHHRWMGSFLDEEKALLFQDWLKPILGETYARAFEHAAECDANAPLNQVLYNDLRLYLEGDILVKVDRASMACSLEVRVPFLNRRVVDFAMALPIELKLRGLTGKYILRRAFADLLPKAILQRSKQGFAMPIAHWLKGPLLPLLRDMLAPERIRRQGLFEADFVQRMIDDHLQQRRDYRKQLWTLLVFQLWHARYMEGDRG